MRCIIIMTDFRRIGFEVVSRTALAEVAVDLWEFVDTMNIRGNCPMELIKYSH